MGWFGKKRECDMCDMNFKSESDLKGYAKMHMEDHSGHEHFQCEACGMVFHSESELKQHGQRYHA